MCVTTLYSPSVTPPPWFNLFPGSDVQGMLCSFAGFFFPRKHTHTYTHLWRAHRAGGIWLKVVVSHWRDSEACTDAKRVLHSHTHTQYPPLLFPKVREAGVWQEGCWFLQWALKKKGTFALKTDLFCISGSVNQFTQTKPNFKRDFESLKIWFTPKLRA